MKDEIKMIIVSLIVLVSLFSALLIFPDQEDKTLHIIFIMIGVTASIFMIPLAGRLRF